MSYLQQRSDWELVGGPKCGEKVALEPGRDRYRIVRRDRHDVVSVNFNAPKPDDGFLHGDYATESERDTTRRILRWHGWR